MTWTPDPLLEDFRTGMAGVSLAHDAIAIDRRPAPHVPPKALPPGKMAVYVLEQMVDEYLQYKGYFTRHNINFRPSSWRPRELCPAPVAVMRGGA